MADAVLGDAVFRKDCAESNWLKSVAVDTADPEETPIETVLNTGAV